MGTTHSQGEGTTESHEHQEAEIIKTTWKSVHHMYYTDQKKKKLQRVDNTSPLSHSQVKDLELEAKFEELQGPWSHP